MNLPPCQATQGIHANALRLLYGGTSTRKFSTRSLPFQTRRFTARTSRVSARHSTAGREFYPPFSNCTPWSSRRSSPSESSSSSSQTAWIVLHQGKFWRTNSESWASSRPTRFSSLSAWAGISRRGLSLMCSDRSTTMAMPLSNRSSLYHRQTICSGRFVSWKP